VVTRGQRAGTIRRDVDAEAVAATIAGGIMGAEIQHYQDPERIDLRAVLDTLVEPLADWLPPPRADFAREVLRPQLRESDEKNAVPAELPAKSWELGLVQESIPEEFGGF